MTLPAQTAAGASAARPAGTGRFRLGRGWRQVALITHVVAGGAWIGIDVIVGLLVLTGRFGADREVRALAYRSLATFVVWPMMTAGLVCLLSGLVLGLGTAWGLLRYWWVVVKLGINLILCTLIVVALQPGMDEVDRYGRHLLTGEPDPLDVSRLFFPPAVSLIALLFAVVLSVVKPWGRVRGNPKADAKRFGRR
jgi:hypothetical protein